ncbi:Peridinin-chlorophyll a-binding protein, chloroplastic [Symbiodinium microadriaticum]|uniref:Peridinin-chlorophyll a-binding protein, chloroplastic n=1 Tax=Symbiodinium microadriaticum TaxID=2951 RepID=A0A1Q9CUV4_SYMMI|nr:Peridinin-chlorophyll a-binding protein, chloroplastic [Symbiodinium microadriaticum]
MVGGVLDNGSVVTWGLWPCRVWWQPRDLKRFRCLDSLVVTWGHGCGGCGGCGDGCAGAADGCAPNQSFLTRFRCNPPCGSMVNWNWAERAGVLKGVQHIQAFPIGSAVLMLEAAIMRAAEEQQMQILGHGAGARNRRLFVQDPVPVWAGRLDQLRLPAGTGKLLVTPLDHSPEQMQKVATMITTRQQLESFDGQGASVSMEVAQAQEEPAAPETQQAFLVDNRAFKADSDGVGYRASPDLEDKALLGERGSPTLLQVVPARTALWGTVVHGVADDEGTWPEPVSAQCAPSQLNAAPSLRVSEKDLLLESPKRCQMEKYICIDPKGASTYFQPGAPSESGQATTGTGRGRRRVGGSFVFGPLRRSADVVIKSPVTKVHWLSDIDIYLKTLPGTTAPQTLKADDKMIVMGSQMDGNLLKVNPLAAVKGFYTSKDVAQAAPRCESTGTGESPAPAAERSRVQQSAAVEQQKSSKSKEQSSHPAAARQLTSFNKGPELDK